jgi:hypothetical protein
MRREAPGLMLSVCQQVPSKHTSSCHEVGRDVVKSIVLAIVLKSAEAVSDHRLAASAAVAQDRLTRHSMQAQGGHLEKEAFSPFVEVSPLKRIPLQ